jgi:hypothetical protein
MLHPRTAVLSAGVSPRRPEHAAEECEVSGERSMITSATRQGALGYLVLFRRFLVLIALMFWQGGFTFYASVVVPIGTAHLHSATDQGFITREVTNYLNLSGAIALVVLGFDVACSRRFPRRVWLARAISWLMMGAILAVLVWLHTYMDQYLDPETQEVLHRSTFRLGHRWYLWLSTVQWGFGLLFAALTLLAWRQEDRAVGPLQLK